MKRTMIFALAAVAVMSSCNVLGSNKAKTVKDNKDANSLTTQAMNITPEMIAGEWFIVDVNQSALPQEDQMPYINFDAANGRFYASNGCNVINGDFKLNPNATLSFSGVASTMRYCPDVLFEAEISAMLGGNLTPAVSIRRSGHESYLTLADGGITVVGRRHNMEFLNGQWQVVQINGKAVNDEEANLFIDINELKVHGNTGCNYFNGDIYIDPSKSNSIEFGNMGLTRMACPKFEQEQAMMLALESVTTAIAGDNNRVMLLNSRGNSALVLQRSIADQ